MQDTKKFEENEDFAEMCKPTVPLFVAYVNLEGRHASIIGYFKTETNIYDIYSVIEEAIIANGDTVNYFTAMNELPSFK